MAMGGGKGVIDYPPDRPDSFDVLQRFYEAHRPLMEAQYVNLLSISKQACFQGRTLSEIQSRNCNPFT